MREAAARMNASLQRRIEALEAQRGDKAVIRIVRIDAFPEPLPLKPDHHHRELRIESPDRDPA